MEQEVFISYSRRDSKKAERLYKAMDEAGITDFIDRYGISGEKHFLNVVSEQILACKVSLFLGNVHAYESKWTMKEVTYVFLEKDLEAIIPVIIDNEPMPNRLRFLFFDISFISQTELLLTRTIKEQSVLFWEKV